MAAFQSCDELDNLGCKFYILKYDDVTWKYISFKSRKE